MFKFVYEVRIVAETTDAGRLSSLRHQLEMNEATLLGGIGRMRMVKQPTQCIAFITMLDVSKNEEAIQRIDGLYVKGIKIRCHAEHYAFFCATPHSEPLTFKREATTVSSASAEQYSSGRDSADQSSSFYIYLHLFF